MGALSAAFNFSGVVYPSEGWVCCDDFILVLVLVELDSDVVGKEVWENLLSDMSSACSTRMG